MFLDGTEFTSYQLIELGTKMAGFLDSKFPKVFTPLTKSFVLEGGDELRQLSTILFPNTNFVISHIGVILDHDGGRIGLRLVKVMRGQNLLGEIFCLIR